MKLNVFITILLIIFKLSLTADKNFIRRQKINSENEKNNNNNNSSAKKIVAEPIVEPINFVNMNLIFQIQNIEKVNTLGVFIF